MSVPGDAAQPLLRFAAALGKDGPDFRSYERLADVRFYDEAFPATSLQGLDYDAVKELKEAYGGALQLVILRGALPLLDLGKDFDSQVFERFQRRLEGTETVVVDVVLDKQVYVQRTLAEIPASCHALLMLFPEGLRRYLMAASLRDLEADLWPRREAKTLLLIPALDVCLDGPLLAVYGGRYAGRWREAFVDAVDALRAQQVYADATEQLRWEARWLTYLTPLHLWTTSKTDDGAPRSEPLARSLHMHLANAILLYTAERTVRRGEAFTSSFATSRKTIEAPHLTAAALEADEALGRSLGRGIEGLWKTFVWTYEPPWSPGERLPLVQIAVVNALRAARPEQRLQVLLNNASQIYDNLEWNWGEFLEDKFDTYLDQVQRVEAYVSETVSSHSAQATELVKSVSETMLAAVGVTLASFVAALFGDNFDATVFRIGIWAYVAYVFFFPLLYSLSNQVSRYRALEEQFRRRRQRFEQRLHPDAVADIVGDEVRASRRRFWLWFRITVTVYFVVMAVGAFAAFAAPGVFVP